MKDVKRQENGERGERTERDSLSSHIPDGCKTGWRVK